MHESFREFLQNSPFGPIDAATFAAFVVVAVVALILKGISLWYAARGGQKWWFIALLIVNTFGILEIIYLIWFRPQSFELEERPADQSSVGA
jgi:hypothetical protein